jgi:hypothetical protein
MRQDLDTMRKELVEMRRTATSATGNSEKGRNFLERLDEFENTLDAHYATMVNQDRDDPIHPWKVAKRKLGLA